MALMWGFTVLTLIPNEYGSGWIFGPCAFTLIIIITVLALEPIRRGWYELFYYPHLLGLGAVAFAMAHSVAVRYAVTPGLVLYVLDKLIIAARLARTHRATVTAVSGGTKIVVEDSVNLRYRPGQFFFLVVPGASWCETHPFTASSAPGSGPLTFLAKDMGKTSSTHRLAQLSQKASVPLRLHGPYGTINISFADCRVAVLVAGGAGVTPMASLAAHFLSSRPEGLQVVFVWVCRTPDAFSEWFPTLLQDLLANPAFTVHLYCTVTQSVLDVEAATSACEEMPLSPMIGEEGVHLTGDSSPKAQDERRPALPLRYGRPDWGEIFQPHASLGSQAAVLVCGPPAMEAAVQRVARAHGHRFHKETFAL
jgi:NAD(P)H-flavin reductase